jgi:hypothetical protein
VLDRLADAHKGEFKTDRLADKAEVKFKGRQLHLIKPNTYMNLSGKAIAYWMQDLKIPKENPAGNSLTTLRFHLDHCACAQKEAAQDTTDLII